MNVSVATKLVIYLEETFSLLNLDLQVECQLNSSYFADILTNQGKCLSLQLLYRGIRVQNLSRTEGQNKRYITAENMVTFGKSKSLLKLN